MKKSLKNSAAIAAVLVLLLSLNSEMNAQPVKEEHSNESSLSYELGMSVSKLPRSIVGEEISQIPMLELGVSYKMNQRVKFYSKLSSCYLANCMKVGAECLLVDGKVQLYVGNEYKVCYGNAQMDGFDATNIRLVNAPKVKAGIMNDLMDVYLSGSVNLQHYEKSTFGNHELPGRAVHISGAEGSLELVYKDLGVGDLVIGFSLQYSEPDYKTWLAFSEKMQWNLVPKISLGLKL